MPDRTGEELLILLNRQTALYEKLAAVLRAEQKSLISIDLEKLSRLVRVKEKLVQEIKKLIPPLAQRIQRLALKTDLAPEPLPTLTELAAKLNNPLAARIRQAGQRLVRLKNDTLGHNQDNQRYVQEALGMITDTLAIMTGTAMDQTNRYRANGQPVTRTTGPVRLNREV